MANYVRVSRYLRRHVPVRYTYPGRGHDYDPAWDYPIIETPRELRPVLGHIRQQLLDDLIPRLGLFRKFTIHVAEDIAGKGVALYVDGTVSEPVIVIDAQEHKDVANQLGLSPREQRQSLTASIVHELGHAIEEAHGLSYDEDWAEEFARRYVDLGEILTIEGRTDERSK